ncbi:MAG: hypothetical protein ACK4OK_06745 [Thermoflexus sp.]
MAQEEGQPMGHAVADRILPRHL